MDTLYWVLAGGLGAGLVGLSLWCMLVLDRAVRRPRRVVVVD